jgi:hypothetical protein
MGNHISHEEIVRSFLESKSVDFTALGNFVAEFGSSIAASSRGDYGVRIGHYNILACFRNIAPALDGPIGITSSGIASEVIGR